MLSGVSARSSSLKSLPFKTISRRSSSFLASSSSKNSSSFCLCSSSSCWNNNWDEQRRTTFTSSISKEVERIRSRAKASDISSSSGTTSRTEEKTPPPAQTKKDLFRFNYEHDIRETETMLPFNADKYGGVEVNRDEYEYMSLIHN